VSAAAVYCSSVLRGDVCGDVYGDICAEYERDVCGAVIAAVEVMLVAVAVLA
jgi:hypothetical protein